MRSSIRQVLQQGGTRTCTFAERERETEAERSITEMDERRRQQVEVGTLRKLNFIRWGREGTRPSLLGKSLEQGCSLRSFPAEMEETSLTVCRPCPHWGLLTL